MAFTPLRITTIKPMRSINFDLYIFFKDTFLKYIESGRQLEETHLDKLRKQKVAKFYITDDDEPNYQQFLDGILMEALDSDEMSVDEKVELAEGAASTAVERLQNDPNSKSAYKMTENAANSLRKIVAKNPDALKKLFGKKAAANDSLIKHSLNVSAIATKLGEVMGLSEIELDNLATAALVHDIGVTKLAKNDTHLFLKPRKKFTPDEKRIYNLHVRDASTLLNGKTYINKEIIELVVNHEETRSGSGPQKLLKLTPSIEILSLCDSFDLRMTVDNMTPKDALKDITINELGNYTLEIINKLKEVVKSEGLFDLIQQEHDA